MEQKAFVEHFNQQQNKGISRKGTMRQRSNQPEPNGNIPVRVAANAPPQIDTKKLQSEIQNIEKDYGKADIIELSEPNPVVCNKIKEFFENRAIADPFISGQIYPQKPVGKMKQELVEKLKATQKDSENRIHPWMSFEVQQQVRGLGEEDKQRRRTTNLTGEGIDSISKNQSMNRSSVDQSKQPLTAGGLSSSDTTTGIQAPARDKKPPKDSCGAGCTIF